MPSESASAGVSSGQHVVPVEDMAPTSHTPALGFPESSILPATYTQKTHGPVCPQTLSRLLCTLPSFPGDAQDDAGAERKEWRFEYAKSRTSTCKGCRGAICPRGPRLAWSIQAAPRRSKDIGEHSTFWHVACGIVASKLLSLQQICCCQFHQGW